jgi:predicted metal-dependent phosphoesterase TrpH
MYLKADFHTHTTWSDGLLKIPELIGIYAGHVDILAITDHILDSKSYQLFPYLTLTKDSWPYYQQQLKEVSLIAARLGLLVLPGAEITNNQQKFHILAIGITEYINPDGDVKEIVEAIHAQNGIAIASHPHPKYQDVTQPVHEHFFNNLEKYENVLDAWEVGNRYELFSKISYLGYPYVANADFHNPEDLYSWKNLLDVSGYPNLLNIKKAIKNRKNYIWRLVKS